MSSPSIRIFDENVSLPEVDIIQDIGQTIDVNSVDLLMNHKKLASPPRNTGSPIQVEEIKADEIEFVNLEDTHHKVSFDVKPSTGDSVRIVRDTIPEPPKPIASAPAKSWFSALSEPPSEANTSSIPPTNSSSGGIAGKFSSWFGGNANKSSESEVPVNRASEYLTPEQEFIKKTEALTMLERMEKRGIVGNKMTMANTLEEIQSEVERRKDSKALEASIRFQRSMLTTVTNGMEFLNNRFDPLGIKLDGWSESVNENIEDYDEIFEELYDKYKDKTKVAPEVRLIMSLGLSAAMCHVTNTMFKSRMPGMDDILRNNPDLARQFAQAAATQAVGPGFGNFVGMGMGSSRRGSNAPTPAPMYNDGMFGSVPPPSPPPIPTARREMRGPSGVDDILRTLNQAGEQIPNRSVPPPASPQIDAEEVQSIRSGFTTETARMAGRSRRKPTTSQPVGATLTLNV